MIRVESKFFRKTEVESDFWKMINRIDLADFIYETRPQVRFSSRKRFAGIRVVGKGSWKVLSWKVQIEIGKIEVGKFEPKLES